MLQLSAANMSYSIFIHATCEDLLRLSTGEREAMRISRNSVVERQGWGPPSLPSPSLWPAHPADDARPLPPRNHLEGVPPALPAYPLPPSTASCARFSCEFSHSFPFPAITQSPHALLSPGPKPLLPVPYHFRPLSPMHPAIPLHPSARPVT